MWLLLFGIDRFFSLFRRPGIAVAAILGLGLVLAVLSGFVPEFPLRWVHAKLRRGDYAGALARSDGLLPWWRDAAMLRYMRGTVLLFAGRLVEAESDLRESIALGKG